MGGILDKNGMQDTPVPEISDADLQVGGKVDSFPLPEELVSKYPIDDRSKLAGRSYLRLLTLNKSRRSCVVKRFTKPACQACHGQNGEGIKGADGRSPATTLGRKLIQLGRRYAPVNTAAYFIYENMPLGKSQQLSIQDAWDVAAAFVNSHELQDPRYKGDVAGNAKRYHNRKVTMVKMSTVMFWVPKRTPEVARWFHERHWSRIMGPSLFESKNRSRLL